MRVFISPDYTGTNPYQRLLADALADRGVTVEPVDVHGPLMPVSAVLDRGLPDVFHLHWLDPFLIGRNAGFTLVKGALFLAQLTVLSLFDVRLVWTVHNLVEHDARNPRLERAFKHLVVRLTDAVVVHCDRVDERVTRAYHLPERYRERMHVVPHGHYVDSYENDVSRAAARDELDLDEEFTFLFFGRICEYKDVPGLIEAFGDVDAADARLLVAGNPEDEEIGARVATAAAGDDRVRIQLEFVPEERIQYYMNAADAVVLPFREILTSGSTVLAMSFGNPVVVPDAGCVASLVPTEGGFTYRDDGDDALTAAMERTMEGDLERVGRANRRTVERLDWDRVARLTANAYEAE